MGRFSVKAGKHAFTPAVSLNISRRPGNVTWRVSFNDDCRYILPHPHDQSWNKLCGESFCLLTNHRESAMIGWRYEVGLGVIALTTYYHIEGRRVIGKRNDSEILMLLPFGVEVDLPLNIDYNLKKYTWQVGNVVDVQDFTHSRKWTREIGSWFGGPIAAPKPMSLYKRRI